MRSLNEKYVTNRKGERIGILLEMSQYRKLLVAVEELEAIRAFDAAKSSGERPVPFDEAVKRIEKSRR